MAREFLRISFLLCWEGFCPGTLDCVGGNEWKRYHSSGCVMFEGKGKGYLGRKGGGGQHPEFGKSRYDSWIEG